MGILLKLISDAAERWRISNFWPVSRVCFLLHFCAIHAISNSWFWVGLLCFLAFHILEAQIPLYLRSYSVVILLIGIEMSPISHFDNWGHRQQWWLWSLHFTTSKGDAQYVSLWVQTDTHRRWLGPSNSQKKKKTRYWRYKTFYFTPDALIHNSLKFSGHSHFDFFCYPIF